MDFIEKFNIINKQYEDDVFNLFKCIIDEAKLESTNLKYNPVECLCYVCGVINNAYIQLAISNEIISDEKSFTKSYIKYIISEKLFERIEMYIQPLYDNVREYIVKLANDLLYSTSLEELKEKYEFLMSLISNKIVQENSYLYEDIQLER